MVWMNSNLPCALPLPRGCLLVGLGVLGGLASHADAGQLFLGLAGTVDGQQFTYGKTVYVEGSRDQYTQAAGDADQTLPGLSAFAGYRWPLPGGSRLRLDAEVDVAWQRKRLDGHLEGTGYTWTDTWPEDWWLKRNTSYGVTARLGRSMEGAGFGLYALAGLRRIESEFSITETGCPGPELMCPPTPLASFSETVDRRHNAWTFGAGLERQLGERSSIQLEVRHTRYRRNSRDRLFEGGVVIPSALNGRETGAALRLLRYFQGS